MIYLVTWDINPGVLANDHRLKKTQIFQKELMNGHEAAIGFDWGLGFTSFVSCFGGAEQNIQTFVLYGSRQTSEAFLKRLAMGQNWV